MSLSGSASALSWPALPCPALCRLGLTQLALPHPVVPRPYPAVPRPASPTVLCPVSLLPCPALPCPAPPRPALPCSTLPCVACPTPHSPPLACTALFCTVSDIQAMLQVVASLPRSATRRLYTAPHSLLDTFPTQLPRQLLDTAADESAPAPLTSTASSDARPLQQPQALTFPRQSEGIGGNVLLERARVSPVSSAGSSQSAESVKAADTSKAAAADHAAAAFPQGRGNLMLAGTTSPGLQTRSAASDRLPANGGFPASDVTVGRVFPANDGFPATGGFPANGCFPAREYEYYHDPSSGQFYSPIQYPVMAAHSNPTSTSISPPLQASHSTIQAPNVNSPPSAEFGRSSMPWNSAHSMQYTQPSQAWGAFAEPQHAQEVSRWRAHAAEGDSQQVQHHSDVAMP